MDNSTNEKALVQTTSGDKQLSVAQEVKQLERIIDLETRKRKVLTKYVRDNLIEGVDYGSIEGTSRSGAKFQSKKGLFKPGGEKLCSLFHLTPRFEKDNDSWVMFGQRSGVVCYVCRLYNQAGEVVGEGRGVASMTESGATENKTVKIAQKRAQVDAVIRFAALSDVFSQDIETVGADELAGETGNRSPKAVYQPKVYMATEGQLTKIAILLNEKGKDKQTVYNHYKVDSLKDLTFKQADATITKLISLPDKKKDEPNEVPSIQEALTGNKEDKSPAQNFQIGWVRLNFDKLKKIGAVDEKADVKNVDFMTASEYAEIKKKFDVWFASYKQKKEVK